MIVCVTGSVCTGKTRIAKIIARKYRLKYVDVNKEIKKNKICDNYDRSLKSYVVNMNKLNNFFIKLINKNKNLVLDSHLSHYLNKKYVDLCVVVKCDIKVLRKRLEKRKYDKKKIRENLDAEIFDVCLVEATELGHKVKVIDTTHGIKSVNL